MSKPVKVSLHPNHRKEMETLSRDTGLTFQQIINNVWVKASAAKAELVGTHQTNKTK